MFVLLQILGLLKYLLDLDLRESDILLSAFRTLAHLQVMPLEVFNPSQHLVFQVVLINLWVEIRVLKCLRIVKVCTQKQSWLLLLLTLVKVVRVVIGAVLNDFWLRQSRGGNWEKMILLVRV